MQPPSLFRVVVSDLQPGHSRPFAVEAPATYAVEMARVTDQPLRAEVELRAISGGVMIDGTVRYESELTCHRCLITWREDGQRRILQLVEPAANEEAEYTLSGDELDLEPLVRDEVTLALPLAPLCREDCAGLCPACGADLNTDACPGHEEEPVSPFAGLRDLLETQE